MNDLTSPLINRELTTHVRAHAWPTLPSSALCEAFAFFQQEDAVLQKVGDTEHRAQRFLQTVSKSSSVSALSDFRSGVALVEEFLATDDILKQYQSLLKWSLQMRANSPLCELHRGLARQALETSHQLSKFGNSSVLLVVASSTTKAPTILTSLAEIQAFDWKTMTPNPNATNSDIWEEYSLPGELPIHGGDSNTASPLAILYGDFASAEFAGALEFLQQSFKIPLVVRYLGAVHYEEDPLSAQPTTLGGYGVRLDIRNVEYKVFDDRSSSSQMNDDQEVTKAMINLTHDTDLIPNDFLAGVNISAFFMDQTLDSESNDTTKLRNSLWARHEQQQVQAQKIPPLWQRRQLPLQAAAVLSQTYADGQVDALATMTQLVQDLPSVASTLVQVKIPPHVHQWSEALSESRAVSHTLAPGTLWINGRPTPVTRPSFNVFELLNIVRMEERKVQFMMQSLTPVLTFLKSPSTVLSRVQKAWTSGSAFVSGGTGESEDDPMMMMSPQSSSTKNFRIDVGRGWKKAVMYINDCEKDAQYEQWPRSLRQMLMSMQYGMPPSVRRNLYTITLVMDPTKGKPGMGLQLAMKLVESQYPVRIGVVIVDEEDINKCKAWLQEGERDDEESCPVDPFVVTKDDPRGAPASARAIHRLMNHFLSEYADQPGASLAYLEYFIAYIVEEVEEKGRVTNEDVVKLHAKLLGMMGLGDSNEDIIHEAYQLLSQEESTLLSDSNIYGKALRFAAERGLSPGMSFLNGRPLPDQSEGLNQLFQEEQNLLMGMIMSGEIRDDSPRSIYGKLLNGENVFQRMHPLLTKDLSSQDAVETITHPFGKEALLMQKAPRGDERSDAYFAIDVVLDLSTQEGIKELSGVLSLIPNSPTSIVDEKGDSIPIEVGYQIIPSASSASSSPLCPVLANSALIGLEGLSSIVNGILDRSGEMPSLQALVDTMDEAAKEKILGSQDLCTNWKAPENRNSRAVCNGLVYEYGESILSKDDIELLISLAVKRSTAVYKLFQDQLPEEYSSTEVAVAVKSVASFLAAEETKGIDRMDVVEAVNEMEKSKDLGGDASLRFKWDTQRPGILQSQVVAAVDPVHLSTQRLSPLLQILRDDLNLPVEIILVPAPSISGDSDVPVASYYRFVAGEGVDGSEPMAHFAALPTVHTLTLRMDVPEPWDVQQTKSIQDTDNLRCEIASGCGDDAHIRGAAWTPLSLRDGRQLTEVEYGLQHLLAFGQCYERSGPPTGLQLVLSKHALSGESDEAEMEVSMDGSTAVEVGSTETSGYRYSDTLVMKNVGYWQLRANPGVWDLTIEESSKGSEMFDFADGKLSRGRFITEGDILTQSKKLVLKDFVNKGELLYMKRRPGYDGESLFFDNSNDGKGKDDEVIHVFSLATGHLYERFLKIMMLSVTKRTSSKVKFWLFQNFLSPTFQETSKAMAKEIGCEVEFVTYKWPEWLRGQTEKQRIIWGYKILFLDVLFPLDVDKIIYVDADQVVRSDLKELWDMDLHGKFSHIDHLVVASQ